MSKLCISIVVIRISNVKYMHIVDLSTLIAFLSFYFKDKSLCKNKGKGMSWP